MALLVSRERSLIWRLWTRSRAMKFNPEPMILANPHQLANGYSMRDLSVK
jgi:hypothetical protein